MKADRFKVNDQDVEAKAAPVVEQPVVERQDVEPKAAPARIPADAVPVPDGELDPVSEAILDEIPDRPKQAAPVVEQQPDVERQDDDAPGAAHMSRAALVGVGGVVCAVLGVMLLRGARPGAVAAAAAPVAPVAPVAPAMTARPAGLVVK